MAIIQPIENGKVVDQTQGKNKTENKNTADKEMFLKLLVAEMQYQDPLEPTSNTDYVKELASFSEIEAIQSVQDKMSTLQSNSLVGKYVILLTTGASGNQEYVSGKVDYVATDESGEIFLSVNEQLYSMNDLDSICDEAYYNAVIGSENFHTMVETLPNVYTLTIADEEKVTAARKLLDNMSSYQLQYLRPDDIKKLNELENRIAALKEMAGAADIDGNDDQTKEPAQESKGVDEA